MKKKENNTNVLSIVNNLTNCWVLSERILPDLVRGTLTVWHWLPTTNPYLYSIGIHSSESSLARNSCVNHLFDQLPCVLWRKIDPYFEKSLVMRETFLTSRWQPWWRLLVMILSLVALFSLCALLTLNITYTILHTIQHNAINCVNGIIKSKCVIHYR